MRLIDHVRERFSVDMYPLIKSANNIGQMLLDDDLPVLIADDIADWIDDLPIGEEPIYPNDFGNIAPPFTQFWVECSSTGKWPENEPRPKHLEGAPPQIIERGVYFLVIDKDQIDSHLSKSYRDHMRTLGAIDDSKIRWIYMMMGFIRYGPWVEDGRMIYHKNREAHTPLILPGNMVVHLNSDGILMERSPKDFGYIDRESSDFPDEASSPEAIGSIMNFMPFSLYTISMLHRKADIRFVEPSRQQQRMHTRTTKSKRPLKNHYELRVSPVITKTGLHKLKALSTPRKKRQHGVRGHFRYYSPEAPLFGRTTGMVWIPEHRRGDSGFGEISKRYLVEGPDRQ